MEFTVLSELKCNQDPDAVITLYSFNAQHNDLLLSDVDRENQIGLCPEQTAQLVAALAPDLATVTAERDALKAVVEAARELTQSVHPNGDMRRYAQGYWFEPVEKLEKALAALGK